MAVTVMVVAAAVAAAAAAAVAAAARAAAAVVAALHIGSIMTAKRVNRDHQHFSAQDHQHLSAPDFKRIKCEFETFCLEFAMLSKIGQACEFETKCLEFAIYAFKVKINIFLGLPFF